MDLNKIKREQFKERCLNYLGGKRCYKCGIKHLSIACYDFHHYNGLKDMLIGKMVRMKWEKVKNELDKCVILCANCHREVHYLKEQIRPIRNELLLGLEVNCVEKI